MILRHITLPLLIRCVLRVDPGSRRVHCKVGPLLPELSDAELAAVRDAAIGEARRLGRDAGVRGALVDLEVLP